jgi:uncharacterized membrane protein
MARGERVALAALVLAFAAVYSATAVVKHWHFDTSYDLAIYDQAIWHLSRFERPASSIRGIGNIFGDHFHPVIALFTPLFWIAPAAETLLIAQAVLLAASIVPVFAFARDRLPAGAALTLAAAYGLFWGMQQTAIADVHEAAFAPLAVALLLLAMDRRRWPWFWAAAVGVLAVKEDLAPFLAFVGLYLFVRGEHRIGGWAAVAGLAAFIAIVAVMIPAASDAGEYGYAGTYGAVIARPWLVLETLVTPRIKLLTAFLWVMPFALLPLASPLSVLLVPFALERFLSGSENHWGTIFHYSAALAPVVAMAAADGLARMAARVGDATTRRRVIAIAVGACAVFAAILPGHQPHWRLFTSRTYAFGPAEHAGRDAIAIVPPEASLVAQTAIAPHVSHRRDLFMLQPGAPEAEYVIAMPRLGPWPNASAADVADLVAARRASGYHVVFDRDGWIVLRTDP